jgi:hypothetical protein
MNDALPDPSEAHVRRLRECAAELESHTAAMIRSVYRLGQHQTHGLPIRADDVWKIDDIFAHITRCTVVRCEESRHLRPRYDQVA